MPTSQPAMVDTSELPVIPVRRGIKAFYAKPVVQVCLIAFTCFCCPGCVALSRRLLLPVGLPLSVVHALTSARACLQHVQCAVWYWRRRTAGRHNLEQWIRCSREWSGPSPASFVWPAPTWSPLPRTPN